MRQQTAKILFFLGSRPLKNGEHPIYIRITIEGQFDQTAIKRSVKRNLWNQAKGYSKGKDKNSSELNDFIVHLRTNANRLHKELLFSDAYISPRGLLQALFNSKEEQITLLKSFRSEIEKMESFVGIDYEKVTINRYQNCFRDVAEVIKREYKKEDISFGELNGVFISKLEFHLKTKNELCLNTIVRYMKCFKKITNLALQNDLLKKDPFAGIRYKQPETNPVFLTIE